MKKTDHGYEAPEETAPAAAPAPPTLESVAQKYIASKEELDLGGEHKKVVVQPWHLAAIKAKNAMPGNREVEDGKFRQLLADVLDIRIGGAPTEAPTK